MSIHSWKSAYLLAPCVPRHVRHPPGHWQAGVGQLDEVLLDVAGYLLGCPRAHGLGYLLIPLSLNGLGRVNFKQLFKFGLQYYTKLNTTVSDFSPIVPPSLLKINFNPLVTIKRIRLPVLLVSKVGGKRLACWGPLA